MDRVIKNRLEYHDDGDGVSYEFWMDSLTGVIYRVPIEIYRNYDEAEIVKPNVAQLTIIDNVFADWYFNLQSDQEQMSNLLDLGKLALDRLQENGNANITLQELFDQVDHDIIPLKLTVQYSGIENNDEIGEVFPEYELKLV